MAPVMLSHGLRLVLQPRTGMMGSNILCMHDCCEDRGSALVLCAAAVWTVQRRRCSRGIQAWPCIPAFAPADPLPGSMLRAWAECWGPFASCQTAFPGCHASLLSCGRASWLSSDGRCRHLPGSAVIMHSEERCSQYCWITGFPVLFLRSVSNRAMLQSK